MKFLFSDSAWATNCGLLIMRVGIGLFFVQQGYGKLMSGAEQWLWLGQQMHYVGIGFLPLMWGVAAVATELFGGMCVVLGCMTRLASFLLAFVMFIALVMHYNKGENFYLPLVLLIFFCGLIVSGAGRLSVDTLLYS